MGVVAAAARELIAAGVTGDALVTALERIEHAATPARSAAAERMMRYRARERADAEASRVTHGDASGSPDKETSPTPPKETNPSTSLRSENKQAARASRIPEDFQPDLPEAERLGLSPADAQRESANFIDYWHQANGRTAIKRDWPAAFRVWCRKAVQDRSSGNRGPPQRRANGLDALMNAAADLDEQLSRQPVLDHDEPQFKLLGK